jgi:DNA-directed RNA polymerase specialized sigma24 family protein
MYKMPNMYKAYTDFDLIALQMEYQAALQELPEKCREVFTMSRNGATNKEIGEALNISTKTVEQHITKALRTLRILLNSHLNSLVGMVFLGVSKLLFFFLMLNRTKG